MRPGRIGFGPNWLAGMADDAARGRAFDLEKDEARICGGAAPVRDVWGRIVAATVSVPETANTIGGDCGTLPKTQ